MAVELRRPILVGGLSLSFALWLLDSFHEPLIHIGQEMACGAIALGAAAWFFQRNHQKKVNVKPLVVAVNREMAAAAIAAAENAIAQLQTETDNLANSEFSGRVLHLQEQIDQLKVEMSRPHLRLAVTGGKAVGKTSLIQAFQSNGIPESVQKIEFRETLPLFTSQDINCAIETTALQSAIAADAVLFLTTGDLTESEFQTLQQLNQAGVRTLLVWNKQDQYTAAEQPTILQQLEHKCAQLNNRDVFAIAADPTETKVRQHQPDGSVQESLHKAAADIRSLSDRLQEILATDTQALIWASTYRMAHQYQSDGREMLNRIRRDRAVPILEQYQWIAAAAAFANPVPALDLLATGAITGQLVLDLGAIYQQKFSLQQAQAVAGTLASQMVKLGLVELSTQTVTTLLKSNAVTFMAGGVIQGVSAAYLTRIAGLSLIEYFTEVSEIEGNSTADGPINLATSLAHLERLSERIQKIFQQNQRGNFLQSFVQQVVTRIAPNSSPAVPISELS